MKFLWKFRPPPTDKEKNKQTKKKHRPWTYSLAKFGPVDYLGGLLRFLETTQAHKLSSIQCTVAYLGGTTHCIHFHVHYAIWWLFKIPTRLKLWQRVGPEVPVFYWTLTDVLCCTCSFSSSSHHILSSSRHSQKVIIVTWETRGWHKGVATPSIYAPGSVHILSITWPLSPESELVLYNASSYIRAWVHRVILERSNTTNKASCMLNAWFLSSN